MVSKPWREVYPWFHQTSIGQMIIDDWRSRPTILVHLKASPQSLWILNCPQPILGIAVAANFIVRFASWDGSSFQWLLHRAFCRFPRMPRLPLVVPPICWCKTSCWTERQLLTTGVSPAVVSLLFLSSREFCSGVLAKGPEITYRFPEFRMDWSRFTLAKR